MVDSISLGNIHEIHQAVQTERADAAANRALILETARRLFAERGVAAVNMADIAASAGVGKGTLYRRFDNKGALCLAVMEDALIAFQDVMLERMRQMTVEGVRPLERLNHFLDALIYFSDENMPLLCEINRDGVESGDHTAPYFWLHMTVGGLLRQAIASGQVAADVDATALADMILASISARTIRLLHEERGLTLAQISASVQALVGGLA